MEDINEMNANTLAFTAVKVSKGRKWKGELAYYVGSYSNSFGQIMAKLWEPITRKFVYANTNYCEDITVDQVKLEADKMDYINITIDSTIHWCKSQKPDADENEIKRFARNVLRKHHPEMSQWIDEKLPDNRDVAEEVEKTLNWALNLKSRPMMMYGHMCPGGKPYPIKKQLTIAYNALEKKGITKKEGFKEIWDLNLTIKGLAGKAGISCVA